VKPGAFSTVGMVLRMNEAIVAGRLVPVKALED